MSSPAAQSPALSWPPPLVARDAFDLDEVDTASAAVSSVDVSDLQVLLGRAAHAADARGATELATALNILSGCASMVLRPQDKADAWGPKAAGAGFRTAMPADVKGAQTDILGKLAPDLKHPGLRARISDVVWSNDRTKGAVAALAVEAYTECAELLAAGTASPRFPRQGRSSLEQAHHLERALYISRRTRKTGRPPPDRLVQALRTALDVARDEGAVVPYKTLAELGLYYELLAPGHVAVEAEALAAAPATTYPLARRQLLDLAAQLNDSLGRTEAADRCRLAAVEQILAMRSQVHGAGAEAYWVQVALMALRHIKGTDTRRRELRIELRDLQEDSLSEFGRFSFPIDVGDQRDAMLRAFDKLDLPTALRELACIARSRPVEELRADALKERETAPLMTLMGVKYSDADGKTAAQSPGAPSFEEPDEDWFKATINRAESVRRQFVLAGRFEPARQTIMARYDVSERHLAAIVAQSGFVRPEHEALMTLGFLRWLQGDQRSAVHLLIPQLEACLRFILRLAGHDPVVDFDDLTEEDVGLPAMLGRFRPQLLSVLPTDVVLEIELLFHHRPGSALRHAVAHGLLGAGGCFTPDAVYACWLMYKLTCWPLLSRWDEVVAPAIRENL